MALFFETFHEILSRVFQSEATSGRYPLPDLVTDHQVLNKLLFQGHVLIGASSLETRQQQIVEKMSLLQSLHDFAKEIIVIWDMAAIAWLLLKRIVSIFDVTESTLTVYQNGDQVGHYSYPAGPEDSGVSSLMERSWNEEAAFFMDQADQIYTGVDQIGLKRLATIPIQSHDKTYRVVSFANSNQGFRFGGKDLSLLYHFLNITALALEDIFMLEQIESNRTELRDLTGKLITFREVERRALATDIHDTLAQALTGMSYKIQYCRELINRDPDQLADQMDGLLETVRLAIQQSRELISNLHPEILDTIGLVAALNRLSKNYSRDTGIIISADLPQDSDLGPEANICLFRVAQEALTNVSKPGHTDRARVVLESG